MAACALSLDNPLKPATVFAASTAAPTLFDLIAFSNPCLALDIVAVLSATFVLSDNPIASGLLSIVPNCPVGSNFDFCSSNSLILLAIKVLGAVKLFACSSNSAI